MVLGPAPLATLGAFDVHERIGHGGNGVVFAGQHRRQGVAVALKCITVESAGELDAQRAFEDELRAVAGLDHPAVAVVLDHGLVDRVSAEALGVPVDRPYFVMERAHAAISSRAPGWDELRGVLEAILAALAHAHARGVIHRDVKPGNILHFPGAASPYQLCDFGVAAFEGAQLAKTAVGSPSYMAPELIVGDWRDFGPWTDLYAVGCTAFKLATGSAPYRGNMMSIVRGHLGRQTPDFRPKISVPRGFEGWVRALLATDPYRRVRRAADALAGLRRLGPAVAPVQTPPCADGHELATQLLGLRPSEQATAPLTPLRPPPEESSALTPLSVERALPAARPPSSWRPTRPRSRGVLWDAGLALYGLRRPAMVGRVAERDRLWSALDRVARSGRPHGVLIRGPAGMGKSELARWMCEHAEESGAAAALMATHGERPGPRDGLVEMLRQALRCEHQDRASGAERVARILGPAAEQAAWLLWPPDGDLAQDAIHRAMAATLAAFAQDRPLVLWLDDLHFGARSRAFARWLFAEGAALPLLLVGTAPESSTERSEGWQEQWPDEIRLGPLDPKDRGSLLKELLGLDDTLAESVHARTGGVPLFAVQLVGDWVQRGVLEVAEHGFALAAGAEISLPEPLHALWQRRLAHVLRHQPADAELALELAAVLGTSVDDGEWSGACAASGTRKPGHVVVRMFQTRLAERTEGLSWRFVHNMLTESLLRSATEAGRLDTHRQRCVEVLHAQADKQMGEGRSREAATTYERALGIAEGRGMPGVSPMPPSSMAATLYGLALAHQHTGRPAAARARYAESRQAAILADDAGLAARASSGEANVVFQMGELGEAIERYRSAQAALLAAGDRAGWAAALANEGSARLVQGRMDEAERLARRAWEAQHAMANLDGEAAARGLLARVFVKRGQHREAAAEFADIVQLYDKLGNRRRAAMERTGLATLWLILGDIEQAEAGLRDSLAVHQELGNTPYEAVVHANLGQLYLTSHRADEARAPLEEALRIHRKVGNPKGIAVALVNLCDLHCELADPEPAGTWIVEALAIAEKLDSTPVLGAALAVAARLYALQGRLDEADRTAERAEEALRSAATRIELAHLLVTRAEMAAASDRPEAARAALEEASSLADEMALGPDTHLRRRIGAVGQVPTSR
jgi:eukaryotic-like serine/threonine-protein kinase